MEVPPNYNVEQISYAKNRYRIKEFGEFQFKFFVESKDIFLSSLRPSDKLNPADTLLSIAENKCYFSLRSTGPGGASYGRVDTLYEWSNSHGIRVIEIHRTQVFNLNDGSVEYGKSGPLFLVKLTSAQSEYYLEFDFFEYFDFEVIKNIMASINYL
jgi:hypothetical protein